MRERKGKGKREKKTRCILMSDLQQRLDVGILGLLGGFIVYPRGLLVVMLQAFVFVSTLTTPSVDYLLVELLWL